MIRVAPHNTDASLLIVDGELDYNTAPRLREAVAVAHAKRDTVRLDLAGVEFIDCTGMNALVDLCSVARAIDKVLLIANPSPRVQRLLALTSSARHLQFAD